MAERKERLQTTDYPLRPRSEASRLPTTRSILGYEPLFDTQAYQALTSQENFLSQQEFTRRKEQLDTRTQHNLETALGERYNLQISQVQYRIKDGQFISEEHDELFLDVIKRGQRYRLENGSNDIEREGAEIEGFEKVQKILTGPKYQDAKVIIISPKGNNASMYQHNFFDIYERQGTQITMTRFVSKSSMQEFREAANLLDPFNNLGDNPKDCDFLQNPLITYKNHEEIIESLNLDKNAMAQSDYQKLIETVAALKLSYLNALYHQRYDEAEKIYTATLNLADDIILNPAYDQYVQNQILVAPPAALIATYGLLQPRPVLAGCGLQTSFAAQNPRQLISLIAPFSVADFGLRRTSASEDQYGTLEIHCEECEATYNRNPGKLEAKCRRCGGTRGITC